MSSKSEEVQRSKDLRHLARSRRQSWSRSSSLTSQGLADTRTLTGDPVGAIDRLLAEVARDKETSVNGTSSKPSFNIQDLPNSRQWAGIFTPKTGTRSRSQSRGGDRSEQRPRSRALAVALSHLCDGNLGDGGVIITDADMQEMWQFSQLSTPERPPPSVCATPCERLLVRSSND